MSGYIDMHCDTLSAALRMGKDTVRELNGTMVDLERLKKSGAGAQFFAMFLSQKEWFAKHLGFEGADLTELMMKMYRIFQNTLAENAGVSGIIVILYI